jgi:hypothetical protein
MRAALLGVLLAVSCHSTTSSLTGAGVITAEAMGAAALSRSQGGCIAICTGGTVCNPRSGLCERPPCGDASCGPGERCEVSFKGSQCVSTTTGVATQAPGTGGAAGVGPIPTAPDANHASPTVVPAAEKK